MKLTKYVHACLVLEEQGQKLVIDPGVFTPELGDLSNIAVVVVTHVHADHFSLEHIQAIIAQNPQVQIVSTAEVITELLKKEIHNGAAVTGGMNLQIGPFKLQFFGAMHALIHGDKPHNQNVGVLVNDNLYFPGDSFTRPTGSAVKTLALPVSGPWLKLGESIDLYNDVHPAICFPTHNALLSELGETIGDNWLKPLAQENGTAYQLLQPGESLEI